MKLKCSTKQCPRMRLNTKLIRRIKIKKKERNNNKIKMRGRPSRRPVQLLSPGPINPGRAYGLSPFAASVIPFTFTRLHSLCATTESVGLPPPPPPPYARCRGLRRSLRRLRAPTRYSHPFLFLSCCAKPRTQTLA